MQGGGDLATIEQWKHVADVEPDKRLRSVYAPLALVFTELVGRETPWTQALEAWNVQKSMFITQWLAEGRRADILCVLRLRFRAEAPPDLAAAIDAIVDEEELNRWLDAAVTAPSLDAFRAAVSHNGAVAQS